METHVLKCATDEVPYEGLQGELKKFWDLESLGIKTPSIHEEFLENLTYRGDHYQVNLLWKVTHPPLPDNYELSQQRLSSLLSRLRKEPEGSTTVSSKTKSREELSKLLTRRPSQSLIAYITSLTMRSSGGTSQPQSCESSTTPQQGQTERH